MSFSWMRKAACKGADTELFFPKQDAPIHYRSALQYCMRCPVRQACLQYALDTGTRDGMYGGMVPRDRKRVLEGKLDPAKFTPGHGDKGGSTTGYYRHIQSHTAPCSECTAAYIAYVTKGKRRRDRAMARIAQAERLTASV